MESIWDLDYFLPQSLQAWTSFQLRANLCCFVWRTSAQQKKFIFKRRNWKNGSVLGVIHGKMYSFTTHKAVYHIFGWTVWAIVCDQLNSLVQKYTNCKICISLNIVCLWSSNSHVEVYWLSIYSISTPIFQKSRSTGSWATMYILLLSQLFWSSWISCKSLPWILLMWRQ